MECYSRASPEPEAGFAMPVQVEKLDEVRAPSASSRTQSAVPRARKMRPVRGGDRARYFLPIGKGRASRQGTPGLDRRHIACRQMNVTPQASQNQKAIEKLTAIPAVRDGLLRGVGEDGTGASRRAMFRACGPEGFEDAPAVHIAFPVVFGVPLHADHEGRGAFHTHGLDRAVRRPGFRGQARRQALDALVCSEFTTRRPARRDSGVSRAASTPCLSIRTAWPAVRTRGMGWSEGVEWSIRPGRSWMRWSRLPPSATFSSCMPRQMASSGTHGRWPRGSGAGWWRRGNGLPACPRHGRGRHNRPATHWSGCR